MNRTEILIVLAALAIVFGLVFGCSDDARVAQVAREAADRQAEQNREMAKVNQTVAEATERLVEADAESRRELVTLQQDLRADQADVNEGRDALESERKKIAAHRHRDPIIADAVKAVGLTIACLLPLVLCWYLLQAVHGEQDDSVVAEILIEELASEHSTLLPPFTAGPTPEYTLLADADDHPDPADQQEETETPSPDQDNHRKEEP